MNVLLADDERLVRSSLSSMLQELQLPVHIMGEARNGLEMVEMVERLKPDVVFVDIRMPKLSGLEGIAQGRIVSPDTQWIILSGFSDFAYAQEALRLGTSNYLLKPVSPEQLEACMKDVWKVQEKYIAGLNREFERVLMSILSGTRALDDPAVDQRLLSYRYKGTFFFVDSCLPELEKRKRLQSFAADTRSLLERLSVFKDVRSALITLRDGNLAAFWAWDGEAQDERIKETVEAFDRHITEILAGCVYEQFSISAVQPDTCGSLSLILQQIADVQRLTPLRPVLPAGDEHMQQHDLVQRVLAYMEQSYMKDIGIAQIAGELGVTPNYLSSLFHKKAGKTFVKHLTHMRLQKAKELLLTKPGLKIQTVAEEVGYYSPRHFTRLFKEHFGCYPSELREKNRTS